LSRGIPYLVAGDPEAGEVQRPELLHRRIPTRRAAPGTKKKLGVAYHRKPFLAKKIERSKNWRTKKMCGQQSGEPKRKLCGRKTGEPKKKLWSRKLANQKRNCLVGSIFFESIIMTTVVFHLNRHQSWKIATRSFPSASVSRRFGTYCLPLFLFFLYAC